MGAGLGLEFSGHQLQLGATNRSDCGCIFIQEEKILFHTRDTFLAVTTV